MTYQILDLSGADLGTVELPNPSDELGAPPFEAYVSDAVFGALTLPPETTLELVELPASSGPSSWRAVYASTFVTLHPL